MDGAACLVGWLLDKPQKLMEVTISADIIHNNLLKEIFKVILLLDRRGTEVCVDSVHDELVKIGVECSYVYLLELTLRKVNGSISGDVDAIEARIRTADACHAGYETSALLVEAAERGDVQAMQAACDRIMQLGAESKSYDFLFVL